MSTIKKGFKGFNAVKVDGKKILPGVWYALKSRKIVQVSEEE